MRSKPIIYSSRKSNALSYTLDFVFNGFLGCGYRHITELASLEDEIDLNYSAENISGALKIFPNNYLFSEDLKIHPSVDLGEWLGIPVFFQGGGDLPFDLFAAIFFLLSRAEEYKNPKRDKHGRFLGEYSLLEAGLIERPLIDEWLVELQRLLDRRITNIEFPRHSFRWINTYDIDVAFAYRYRSPVRFLGANAKNLSRGDFKEISRRFRVLFGKEQDPYDSYGLQKEISEEHADETHYFFLVANKSRYDRNLNIQNPGMKKLILLAREYAQIGLHPSYSSGEKPGLIQLEKKRLDSILNEAITASRQHFLRFDLPTTYRHLLSAGLTNDFSMAYADQPGFRAGTSQPFYFFDIGRNKTTSLKIHPLAVMDGSLRDYKKLTPNDALIYLKEMINKVATVKGDFTTLWHNDTLSPEKENKWREVYLEMTAYICKVKGRQKA